MGLRERFERLLSRGEAPDADPDELVELVTVPAFESNVLVAELGDHGIAAAPVESFDLVTKTLSDVKLLVPRSQWDEAQAVLLARGAS